MWLSRVLLWLSLAATALATTKDLLRTTSVSTCHQDSQFSASLLNIVFTRNTSTAYCHIIATSSIEGKAVFDIRITVYGYEFMHRVIDPCQIGLPGLCPMVAAKVDTPPFNLPINKKDASQIPGIAYTFPDLDAKVRVYVNMTSGDQAGSNAACLELAVSNGKTVDLTAIQWASAMVILAALLASAFIGQMLGHFNAGTHVAVYALGLLSYFQAQAMIGLCAMPLPPIVRAWTQDFQWSLGLIKIHFMQSVLTWYQRSTGGTPSDLFGALSDASVAVQKRSVSALPAPLSMFQAELSRQPALDRRSGVAMGSSGSYVVRGIQRAAFMAGIEPTNAFMTVIGFFTALLVGAALFMILVRILCEVFVRLHIMDGRGERTHAFRVGWPTMLKGVLFHCLLVGYPALAIYSFWEWTQNDSAAAIVNSVFYFFGATIALAYSTYSVIRIASRSISMHRNPAYMLFADASTLHRLGALYVPFRASGYYFAVPMAVHTLFKAAFIGFAQKSGTTQAIALLLIEAAALITATVLRPWMDKSTNSYHIAICIVNFINAIMLLFFANIFDQPALGTGVVGLVFWVLNAAMTLFLLLMLILSTIIVMFRHNPDSRYQFMADDRTSFVKSRSQVHLSSTNELDALAATARGDTAAMEKIAAEEAGSRAGVGGGEGRVGDGPSSVVPTHLRRPLDDETDSNSVLSEFRPPARQTPPITTQAPIPQRSQTGSPWNRGVGYER